MRWGAARGVCCLVGEGRVRTADKIFVVLFFACTVFALIYIRFFFLFIRKFFRFFLVCVGVD